MNLNSWTAIGIVTLLIVICVIMVVAFVVAVVIILLVIQTKKGKLKIGKQRNPIGTQNPANPLPPVKIKDRFKQIWDDWLEPAFTWVGKHWMKIVVPLMILSVVWWAFPRITGLQWFVAFIFALLSHFAVDKFSKTLSKIMGWTAIILLCGCLIVGYVLHPDGFFTNAEQTIREEQVSAGIRSSAAAVPGTGIQTAIQSGPGIIISNVRTGNAGSPAMTPPTNPKPTTVPVVAENSKLHPQYDPNCRYFPDWDGVGNPPLVEVEVSLDGSLDQSSPSWYIPNPPSGNGKQMRFIPTCRVRLEIIRWHVPQSEHPKKGDNIQELVDSGIASKIYYDSSSGENYPSSTKPVFGYTVMLPEEDVSKYAELAAKVKAQSGKAVPSAPLFAYQRRYQK